MGGLYENEMERSCTMGCETEKFQCCLGVSNVIRNINRRVSRKDQRIYEISVWKREAEAGNDVVQVVQGQERITLEGGFTPQSC